MNSSAQERCFHIARRKSRHFSKFIKNVSREIDWKVIQTWRAHVTYSPTRILLMFLGVNWAGWLVADVDE